MQVAWVPAANTRDLGQTQLLLSAQPSPKHGEHLGDWTNRWETSPYLYIYLLPSHIIKHTLGKYVFKNKG